MEEKEKKKAIVQPSDVARNTAAKILKVFKTSQLVVFPNLQVDKCRENGMLANNSLSEPHSASGLATCRLHPQANWRTISKAPSIKHQKTYPLNTPKISLSFPNFLIKARYTEHLAASTGARY